jgi:hypothetical protein
MKKLLPLTLLALLLSGCPDSRIPKPPPKVPEPKLMTSPLQAAPASVSHGLGLDLTMRRPA